MQSEQFLTIRGRPLTQAASFRLPIPIYAKAQKVAQRKGLSLAKLFEEWVLEKLNEEVHQREHA